MIRHAVISHSSANEPLMSFSIITKKHNRAAPPQLCIYLALLLFVWLAGRGSRRHPPYKSVDGQLLNSFLLHIQMAWKVQGRCRSNRQNRRAAPGGFLCIAVPSQACKCNVWSLTPGSSQAGGQETVSAYQPLRRRSLCMRNEEAMNTSSLSQEQPWVFRMINSPCHCISLNPSSLPWSYSG